MLRGRHRLCVVGLLAFVGCGGAPTETAVPPRQAIETLACQADSRPMPMDAVTVRVPMRGPRIARQVAAVWCAQGYSGAAAQLEGDVLVLRGNADHVHLGQELAEVLRSEPEAHAGDPFVCRGTGVQRTGVAPANGGVIGPGVSVSCPEPLQTRVLRGPDAQASASEYCAVHASPWGLAGVVGEAVVVVDFGGNENAFERRSRAQ